MEDVYGVEVEVTEKTVDDAKSVALEKLGLPADRVDFTIVQEGKSGFLGTGIGYKPAVVVARAKPPGKKRRRRRRGRSGGGERGGEQRTSKTDAAKGQRTDQRSGNGGRGRQKPKAGEKAHRGDQRGSRSTDKEKPARAKQEKRVTETTPSQPEATIEDQGGVAKEFLEGLLDAFGLEGTVTTSVEEDILLVNVDGDQTEALVGGRGVIMQAVLELTRTVVQRKTFGAPRMRLDIAGYGARRREALRIYSSKLAADLLEKGGEVMLEPMNPADRKVVHDAIAEIDGVRSFSEGEDPHRSVVIAAERAPVAVDETDTDDDLDAEVVDAEVANAAGDHAEDESSESPDEDLGESPDEDPGESPDEDLGESPDEDLGESPDDPADED